MDSNIDDDNDDEKVINMSAVDLPIHQPVIPERRPHSLDIIDVDALDADDVVYVGSARPSQRRRVGEDGSVVPVTGEVIHVTDSEDDNEIQFIGHNPARPQPLPVRRERLFSPPPPLQIGGVPPVPPIPQRFLPLRQGPPPGLIIPNEEPLPFEVDLGPPLSAEQPLPTAAAPSHYVPSMGFGGALLAGVRRIMGPRNTPHRFERRNSWGVSGSFIMRLDPFDFTSREEDDLLDGLDEIGFLGEEDNSFAGGRVRSQIERAFKQRDREADYKPDYSHPDRPLPGFTHDFSPSSSSSSATEEVDTPSRWASGSGTRSCEITLVCAACRDPLVLGASDVGEGRAKRKLWGLRCGHLLDGKCTEKLMEPAPPTCDGTGSSSREMATERTDYLPSSSQDTTVVDSDAGSMRSRLRPRRGIAEPFPSASYPVPVTPSSGRRGAATRVTHRSNRKGKGKMKAPVVEAEHEWSCPVSGCGRVHLSLLMDGRWTMDEKRGAIAVFV